MNTANSTVPGKVMQFSDAGLGSYNFSGVTQATVILLMFLAIFMYYENVFKFLAPREHLTDVAILTSFV